MITPSFPRLSVMVCIILSIGIIISCNKNDNNGGSGKTELLSFGPTGSKHGDTLRFIGKNLDRVTAVQFTGTSATVDQKDFRKQTSELILLIVPESAERGYVTLKTSDGDIITKTQLDLDVLITVSSMTTQARPGDNITINGSYLNWVNRVTFTRDKSVDTFVTREMGKLVVTIPEDAQSGPLILSYGGTEGDELQTVDTLYVTTPAITAIAPSPIKHKTDLTITGTDLDLVKQVLFTGASAPVTSFTSQSADQLVVTVPEDATTGKITIAAASGITSESETELEVLLPVITTISPNPVDPGADITITGTNLDLVTAISFVGATDPVTSFISQSSSQIKVTVPTGVLKGKLTLAVLNSTLIVESAGDLQINGGLPPLADLPFAIYTDGLQNGFQDWSYTATHDFSSTANVRQGTTSIKAVYDATNGYQGVTFHNSTGVPAAGYTKLEFSVFGEAGTDGKKLNIVFNGDYDGPPQATLAAGEWKTFTINLSDVGSPDSLKEVVLQSAGWGGTIHIDHVGLR